ncbi:MAG: XdhC family protein, partial [Anaerolineae bacterium]
MTRGREAMENIFAAVKEALDAGRRVALATIIRTAGSTPREIGAKMMIHPEGQHAGTVGGGCGEAEVLRQALDVIAAGRPDIVRVDLTGEISLESDGICGGIMEVLVEPWPPADEEPAEWRPLL